MVVVWKALVVLRMIAWFRVIRSCVSPLAAAAPFALPMLIMSIMVGWLLILAARDWLTVGLMTVTSLLCSSVCMVRGSRGVLVWIVMCR